MNPLAVSVAPGARKSMPGTMETVLNVGLNEKTAQGIIKSTNNPRFVYDAYRRLIQMYSDVVMVQPRNGYSDARKRTPDGKNLHVRVFNQ